MAADGSRVVSRKESRAKCALGWRQPARFDMRPTPNVPTPQIFLTSV